MRIIAGSARGRTLIAPSGNTTRPTQDKVRESLFNILQFRVQGAHVLDLFAGSGALGLESISRGAEMAVLVDSSRQAVQCITKNIKTVRADETARVLACDYRQAISRLQSEGACFDLVFIDPPYRMEDTGEIVSLLYDGGLLSEDAWLIIEHALSVQPQLPPRFRVRDRRKYGDTQMTFACLAGEAEEPI